VKPVKTMYVKLTADAIVGGRQRWPGEVLEVSADVMRQLIRDGLAVPHVGRGRQCLTAALDRTKIRPYYGEESNEP
jgi:hypothetical protein